MTAQNTKRKLQLPFDGVKIDKQFDILKVLVEWYNKHKKGVKYKDIAGIHASKTNVSSTLSYYSAIGWLKEVAKGQYVPSDDLVQFFEGIDKITPSINLTKNIENTPIGEKIFFFISQKGKVTEDDIIKYIGSEFKLKEKDKNRILKILDILIKLNALKKTDKFLELDVTYKIKKTKKATDQTSNKNIKEFEVAEFVNIKDMPILISILINPETDKEKVRSCIRIILDEIRRWKNEQT